MRESQSILAHPRHRSVRTEEGQSLSIVTSGTVLDLEGSDVSLLFRGGVHSSGLPLGPGDESLLLHRIWGMGTTSSQSLSIDFVFQIYSRF